MFFFYFILLTSNTFGNRDVLRDVFGTLMFFFVMFLIPWCFFRDVFWYLDVFFVMFFGALMFFRDVFWYLDVLFFFLSFLALWCFFRDAFWYLDVFSWRFWHIDVFHKVYLYIYVPDKKQSLQWQAHTRFRIPIGISTDFFQSLLEQSHAYKVEIPIGILLNFLKSPITELQFSCESYLGHDTSQSPHRGNLKNSKSLHTTI